MAEPETDLSVVEKDDVLQFQKSQREKIAALEAATDQRYSVSEIKGEFYVTRRGTDCVVAVFRDDAKDTGG